LRVQDYVFYLVPPTFNLPAQFDGGFAGRAQQAMAGAGLKPGKKATAGCPVKRFLNRILGIGLDLQNQVFDLFALAVHTSCSRKRRNEFLFKNSWLQTNYWLLNSTDVKQTM
jgi:hypothetical protein